MLGIAEEEKRDSPDAVQAGEAKGEGKAPGERERRAGRDDQLGNPVAGAVLHHDARRPEAVFPDEGDEVESAGG